MFIPCLSHDQVPDHLVTQLAKILQQGSQLLLNESDDDEYPPTPSSLTKPDGKSAIRSDKADSERVGSTAPARGVSREPFSYWCLDLLFLICSDISKGRVYAPLSYSLVDLNASLDHESSRRRVAALSLPALIGRCRSTLASYVADEKIRGDLPFPRYALHNMILGIIFPL
jgi:hypothetical protein